jgi:hypothetical protein
MELTKVTVNHLFVLRAQLIEGEDKKVATRKRGTTPYSCNKPASVLCDLVFFLMLVVFI